MGGGVNNLDGLTVKNSGASVPQQHQPSGGWVGNVKGNGTITIQFPKAKGIDLSQYNASGGTINTSDNSLTIGYTVNMIGSAGYYNANVSSSTITLTK